jgi:hypothetical protein
MTHSSGQRLLLRLLANVDQQIAAAKCELSTSLPFDAPELNAQLCNLEATRRYLEDKLTRFQVRRLD